MTIEYREIQPGEEAAAAAVVIAAFDGFIAPGLSEEGIEEFRDYAHPNSIAARRQRGPKHHQVVAVQESAVIGIGEVREWRHVSMLFVHPEQQQKGVGGALFERLLAATLEHCADTKQLTVNSSPYAVPIYERLGFDIAGPPKTISGIPHIPMTFDVSSR